MPKVPPITKIPPHCTLAEIRQTQMKQAADGSYYHEPIYPGRGDDLTYGRWDNRASPEDAVVPAQLILVVEYAGGSDYSGGHTNRSNYRTLKEEFEQLGLMTASGGHGTYALIIPWAVWKRNGCGECLNFHTWTMAETLDCLSGPYDSDEDRIEWELCSKCMLAADLRESIWKLEDYPIHDEDGLSTLTMEVQVEDWDQWGQRDFKEEVVKQNTLPGGAEPIIPEKFDWLKLFWDNGGQIDQDQDDSTIFRFPRINRSKLEAMGVTFPKPRPFKYRRLRKLRAKLNKLDRRIHAIERCLLTMNKQGSWLKKGITTDHPKYLLAWRLDMRARKIRAHLSKMAEVWQIDLDGRKV